LPNGITEAGDESKYHCIEYEEQGVKGTKERRGELPGNNLRKNSEPDHLPSRAQGDVVPGQPSDDTVTPKSTISTNYL
jgi:hypothetical protein